MKKKLLRVFYLFFCLSVASLMAPEISVSQLPDVGDIAIIGYNADVDDEILFISFVDISSGTTIYFSDGDWNGSRFESGEGTIQYEVPSAAITAGDVIEINPGTATSSNGGTVTVNESYNFAGGGDGLYAYLASSPNDPDTFTFLFALTNESNWASADGELTATNLDEGTTALSGIGGRVADNGEYIGTIKGTVSTVKSEIRKVETEWATTDGTGDQSITFNTNNFTLIDPPTVRFTASKLTANEGDETATLTVELAESNGSAVEIDVAFLQNSSTASASDIDNYLKQTISFGSEAAEGATKDITVSLTDDDDFEGDEIAVFQLQNNTAGSVINPEVLNLTITDNDIPNVVINEFLADPPSDANGDGVTSSDDDEFIEIVNNVDTDIDISGWQLSDDGGSNITHTFPSGTVLPANGAAVVFGGGEPTGGFGGAIVQTTSSLRLNNTGDAPALLDDQGNIIQTISYDGSVAGQSETRDPDISGNFVAHSTASGSGGALYSPGTRADGTAFGSTYATGIRGSEGWRMLASPTQNTTFNDLFSHLWMQGVAGSDDPSGQGTLYSWSENLATFEPAANMSDELIAGKGYIVYVFEDDKLSIPGLQGGFPKVISTHNKENSDQIRIDVTANDSDKSGNIEGNEGWNLLGNPYGSDISVTAVKDALEAVNSNLNAHISIWDHSAGSGNGGYVQLNDGDLIAPFQAFWVRYTQGFGSGTATFNENDLAANKGAVFYKQPADKKNGFQLYLGNGEKFDTYKVVFREEGTIGEDLQDAYKLFSLNSNSINLFSTLGEGVKLAINALPRVSTLQREVRIPLRYQLPRGDDYTFRWGDIKHLPAEMKIYLMDNQTGSKIDLRIREKLSFTYHNTKNEEQGKTQHSLLNKTRKVQNNPRFELLIIPTEVNEEPPSAEEMEEPVTLSPNYPNPFRSQTNMTFTLKEPSRVTITIWNIVGQKVATIYDDQMMSEGAHPYSWDVTTDMPSGIYICKLNAAGEVLIRKMTLIK